MELRLDAGQERDKQHEPAAQETTAHLAETASDGFSRLLDPLAAQPLRNAPFEEACDRVRDRIPDHSARDRARDAKCKATPHCWDHQEPGVDCSEDEIGYR